MVLLKVTEAIVEAVKEYIDVPKDNLAPKISSRLKEVSIGSAVSHQDLIDLSNGLLRRLGDKGNKWRLDALLKGTSIWLPPSPVKPEPTAEYKQLMQRLRREEEQRQYERMTAVPTKEGIGSFNIQQPLDFHPQLSHGRDDSKDIDEVTFQDINRQLTLIINVLVTVIASGVTIWFAARYWSVPSRLGLALGGSFAIAIAEVVVYTGYIRRIKEAKTEERKKVEQKEVSTTWIIERKTDANRESIRHRKGKHR